MTQNPLPSGRQRRLRMVAAVLVGAVILTTTALHLSATAADRRSRQPLGIAERTSSAVLAARLEPWNPTFARRAKTMLLWQRGQQLLASGDYNAAVDALREAYVSDVGNAELLELFKRAQATQALETNRKAHLQHGHEGPGGTLRPQDIER